MCASAVDGQILNVVDVIVMCVCFTAKRFEKLAGGKRSATTGTLQKLGSHPDKGARFGFLASLQDACQHSFITGGAPVGDHRLISAILSG